MAVGTKVILRAFSNLEPGMMLTGELPEVGTVVEVPGAGTSRVVWPRSGVESTVNDSDLHGLLSLESEPNGDELLADIGKWVQLVDWPDTTTVPLLVAAGVSYSPRSPGAAGILVAAYGVGDVDDETAQGYLIFVETQNGEHVVVPVYDAGNPFAKPYLVQDRAEVGFD